MYEDFETTTCWLIRDDGTRWAVQKLDISGPGPRVRAVPLGRKGEATEKDREFDLAHGDRLEWRQSDGTVVWATRIPVNTGDGSPMPDKADAPKRGAA